MKDQNNHEADDIISRMGILAERMGKDAVLGKVIGLLHFKGPLTQQQIKDQLECSLSAISQAIKYLNSIGIVETKKGEGRKKLYNLEFSKERFRKAIESMVLFELDPFLSFLEEKEKVLTSNENKEKVRTMKKVYGGMRKTAMKIIGAS